MISIERLAIALVLLHINMLANASVLFFYHPLLLLLFFIIIIILFISFSPIITSHHRCWFDNTTENATIYCDSLITSYYCRLIRRQQ